MTRTCVILLNYNNAEDTYLCLKSLRQSLVPVDVVVVDNSPDDPNLARARNEFPFVKFSNSPVNIGFGQGNNLGVKLASSQNTYDFFFFLNNDATIDENSIQALQSALDQHPEAGITVGRIVFGEDPNVLWYGGGEINWWFGGGKTPGNFGSSTALLAMTGRHVPFATGCALMIRRSVLETCGGFDSRFFLYEEDLELCLRVAEHGWGIWYEPGARIVHRCQGSLRTEGSLVTTIGPLSPRNPHLTFYIFHIFRNRCLNMYLHARGTDRLRFLLGFPLFVFYKCGIFMKSKRFDALGAICKALVDCVRTIAFRSSHLEP
jgi:GT2 family glycosyltransferase